MRRLALLLTVLGLASLGPIVPACSSTGETSSSSNDAGGDSAIGPLQLGGQPCDPTLPNPCLQQPCYAVSCVITASTTPTCVETSLGGACNPSDDASIDFDSGSTTVVTSGCYTSADCPPIPSPIDGAPPTLLACGYSAFDGCSSTGVCVTPEPPTTQDGAVETACGCDGQPVPYVTSDQTSAPVASPVPCAAAIPDSGADAGIEAGIDAGVDASVDAAEDALLDAPSDG
jgi:hypothetical protein